MKKSKRITFLLLSLILLSCDTTNTLQYSLNISISPSEGGTIEPSGGQYEDGETVTLTPIPSEGWMFKEWSGDITGTFNPVDITLDSDKFITGNFVKLEFPLNITVEGEGTVTQEVVPQKITDYEYGTVVRLTPIPSTCYEFVEWTGDLNSTEEIIELTIDSQKDITVTFQGDNCTLSDGLVGWYPFNGNSNDESGNGFDGIVNGPVLTSGQLGNENTSYQFDGNNDWIDLSNNFSVESPFTYSTTIYITGLTNFMGLVGKGEGTSYDKTHSIMMLTNDLEVRLEIGDGTVNGLSWLVTEGYSLNLNEWYNVVSVWDGTTSDNSLSIYVNGTKIVSGGSNTESFNQNVPSQDNRYKIGSRDLGFTGNKYGYFKGIIDDVGIWNRKLSDEEIVELSKGNFNPIN